MMIFHQLMCYLLHYDILFSSMDVLFLYHNILFSAADVLFSYYNISCLATDVLSLFSAWWHSMVRNWYIIFIWRNDIFSNWCTISVEWYLISIKQCAILIWWYCYIVAITDVPFYVWWYFIFSNWCKSWKLKGRGDGSLKKPQRSWWITSMNYKQEVNIHLLIIWSWWRHQMETFSVLLGLCAGNSMVTGEFPTQRPVMGKFDVFFDLCLNKRLSKQSWGWWFETPSHSLWRHCNISPWCVFWTSLSAVQERLLNLITLTTTPPPLCVWCIVRKHKNIFTFSVMSQNLIGICFLSFLKTGTDHYVLTFLMEDMDMLIYHSQYNGCWWPSDARSQGIGSHGMDPVFCTKKVNRLRPGQNWRQCLMLYEHHGTPNYWQLDGSKTQNGNVFTLLALWEGNPQRSM